MKERYRLFLRRKSVYYAFDNTTKTFESLKTKDKTEATRLLMGLNDLLGLVLVGGLQAGAFSGELVHAVEHAAAGATED